MPAKDRPFTRLAAKVCGFEENLDSDRCPLCGHPDPKTTIRDSISMQEFNISGLCQQCQDRGFAP